MVSVSIGSKARNTSQQIELLGKTVRIERRGTDGDLKAAGQLIRDLDGKVDAIGLGGLDLFLVAAGKRFYLRDGLALARNASVTPVVCGAALKDTLERMVVEALDETVKWQGKRVLMVAGVDRFGMAETLASYGAQVTYGDLIFALGLPIPLRTLRQLHTVARILLPVITKVPISWIYPTGEKQTESTSGTHRARYFEEAEVIAGDFHFIRRYAPRDLSGKTVLTNTTTSEDVEDLRRRGVAQLITTTPRFNGRSLATNLLDAALVAIKGRGGLSAHEYHDLIVEAGLGPDIMQFGTQQAGAAPSPPQQTGQG